MKIKSLHKLLFILILFNIKKAGKNQYISIKPQAAVLGENGIQFGLSQQLLPEKTENNPNYEKKIQIKDKLKMDNNIDKLSSRLKKNNNEDTSALTTLNNRIKNNKNIAIPNPKHLLNYDISYDNEKAKKHEKNQINLSHIKMENTQNSIKDYISAFKDGKKNNDGMKKRVNFLYNPLNIQNINKPSFNYYYNPYYALILKNNLLAHENKNLNDNETSLKSEKNVVNKNRKENYSYISKYNKPIAKINEIKNQNIITSGNKRKIDITDQPLRYEIKPNLKSKRKLLMIIERTSCVTCDKNLIIKRMTENSVTLIE